MVSMIDRGTEKNFWECLWRYHFAADQIEHFDGKPVIYHMEGNRGPKKSRTRVPHDLGNPG